MHFSYGNTVTCICDRPRTQKCYLIKRTNISPKHYSDNIKLSKLITMLFLIKVNSNTIELTVSAHSFLLHLRLTLCCINLKKIYQCNKKRKKPAKKHPFLPQLLSFSLMRSISCLPSGPGIILNRPS